MSGNRTCIIGAGSSGMVAAKVLKERGLAFDCYELGSKIGGLWRYNNDNGMSAAYKSLHINSSRQEMAFSDFPMPSHFPDFPHHSQILGYFEDYAEHFGLDQHIQFQSKVEQVERHCDGFNVTVLRDNLRTTKFYRHVIVANGHHWSPMTASFPGDFSGESLHSHDYKTPESLAGKRVLVIGIGNSACDIACEASRVAERVFLSTRRGAHIIPKYIFGKPLDRICPPAVWHYLPFKVLQRVFGAALYAARGRITRYGLPKPDHDILEEHPTVSSDLLNLIGHGKIHLKPNVSELAQEHIRFVDGTTEPIDVLIYATGYKIRFPFLSDSLMNASGNEVPLYRKVVHPSVSNLYFVGLVQPWGPLMPLTEVQSEWIADILQGASLLPTVKEMESAIALEREQMRRRYTNSPRHTIQVDFHPYRTLINQERKQGKYRRRKSPRVDSDSGLMLSDERSRAA